MFYAGIGAREIPDDVKHELINIGHLLAERKIVLRSGGASGADSAFEMGIGYCSNSTCYIREIFLPWKNFNNHQSPYYLTDKKFKELEPIAKSIYLGWDTATVGTKKLHARNIQQILGENPGVSEPSSFVVCWTNRPEGQFGGTRFGMILAKQYGIPVYNLINEDEKDLFYKEIMGYEKP
jgi:hypothetical protein